MILNPPKTFSIPAFWHWIVKDEVETIPSPAPGLAFAIVRLRTTPTQRKTDPAVVSITDSTISGIKGTPIKILKWKDYVKRINSLASWMWLLKPYMMWINRTDEKAEQIVCSCNFVRLLTDTNGQVIEENGFYAIATFFNDADMSQHDANVWNWHNKPWLFHKAISRNGVTGAIYLVANGKHVYFPLLKTRAKPVMWIKKEYVEVLPTTLTDGNIIMQFHFNGASVWGTLATGETIPLRYHPDRDTFEQDVRWPLVTEAMIPE